MIPKTAMNQAKPSTQNTITGISSTVKTLLLLVLLIPAAAQAEDYIWTDNGDGTCTITDYIGPGGNITIPDTLDDLTVTYIGDHAFEYCISLDSVAIPDSVTKIGNYAFDYCSSLTDVIIPDSVTYIGNYVFSLCSSLKTVTIPDSVITIGFRAFFWCTGLTEVAIGNSVTTIGSQAFSNCDILKNICVKANNVVYSSLNGVLFNKNKTELIRYPAGKVGGYIVPDSVISIREEAFLLSSSLTNIIIGKNVTGIGNWAFERCYLLNGVYFKADAPTLGYEVFALTQATVYYIPTTCGWGTSFGYRPTAVWPLSPADVDANYQVNHTDFAMLADQWLQTGCDESNVWCQKADFDKNGSVGLLDLIILADDWLGVP